MTQNKKWSEEAWEAALPVYESILRLPFVTELAAGTLPMDKFLFYLRQDSVYIANYCRVLASIASRLKSMPQIESFLGFAADGVFVEKAMHQSYLEPAGLTTPVEPSPSCLLYMSLLGAQANEPVEVQAAAILPCFWVYLKVGKHIAATASQNNPFAGWIATYSDPAFDVSNRRAIEICDELAEAASPEIRRRMTEIYVMATKMEWLFWHSAYELEKWKI